jgi:hypothetical protein
LNEKTYKLIGSHNNSQSSVMLPSEFKECWEKLLKVDIVDVYCDFLETPITFSNLI